MPLRFAGADADRLEVLLKQTFRPQDIFKVKDAEAKTATVSQCLKDLAKWAQPGGKVLVFISARGFSSTKLADGFVLTWDAAIDKLPGNALSIGELGQSMRAIQSREKYLLLDLCRDPAETVAFDNLINNRVLDSLSKETRQIVLASKNSKRSFEADGSGIYARGLSETLKPGVTLQELFERLTNKTKPKQIPGRPSPASNDGWQDCPACVARVPGSGTPGTLIASLFPAAYLQGSRATPTAAETRDIAEAVRSEENGQRIFVRYGEGNHFPGDPFHQCDNGQPEFRNFRLCREEYNDAASQFDRAADLREKIDREGDQELIQSLRERARFCRAQRDLLDGHAAEAQAALGEPATLQFAESHNVLGIAELEQANYADAEEQFQQAIARAPHWAYPRHNLALVYVEHGRYSDAEKEYREAIGLTPVGDRIADPENPCFHGRKVMVAARPYLYYNLAVLLQRLNRTGEAQQQYCLAEESFRLRIQVLDAGEEELQELRRKAATINLADVDNSMGALFVARNKRDKASAQFQLALANNPNLSAASFNLARLAADKAMARGDRATARQRYEQVLDLPECRNSISDLGCQAAKTALTHLASVPYK